jgi:hypothetical protein
MTLQGDIGYAERLQQARAGSKSLRATLQCPMCPHVLACHMPISWSVSSLAYFCLNGIEAQLTVQPFIARHSLMIVIRLSRKAAARDIHTKTDEIEMHARNK